MKDSYLFIIGIISVTSIITFNISGFRKNEYNPKIFRVRQGSEWRTREFIAYFGFIMPMWLIEGSKFKGIYIFIASVAIVISTSTLNFLTYKSNKN
jgi:hypothetical protein